jgi:type II secretory pathway component PulK
MNMRPDRRSKASRGSVLICVLVCLGIASIVSLGTLKTSLTHRRELQRHWQMEQTQWVLEAGWRRAQRSRLADDQYTGETWQLAKVLHSDLDASVQITIKPQERSQDFDELLIVVTLQTKDPVPIVTRRSRSWQLKNTPTVNTSLETEDSQ